MNISRAVRNLLINRYTAVFLFIALGCTFAEAQPGYASQQVNLMDLVLSEPLIEQLANPNLQLNGSVEAQLVDLNPGYAKVTVSRRNNEAGLELTKITPEVGKKLVLNTDPRMWAVTQMGDQAPTPQSRVAGRLKTAEQPQIKGIEPLKQKRNVFWRITANVVEAATGIGVPPAERGGPPPDFQNEPSADIQDESSSTPPQPGPSEDKAAGGITQSLMRSSIVVNFKKGGFIMYLILMCSVGGLYISLERTYVLRRGRLMPDNFVQGVLKRFSKEYEEHKQDELVRDIRDFCENKDIPVARSLKSGLMVYHEGLLGVKSAITSTNAHEGAIMERGVGILGVLANISPLLGLLGTVTGMIKAFEMISIGGSGRAEVVANGISEALITTAGGLFVGIPLLLLFFFFQSKIDDILIDLEDFCLEVVEKLIVRGEQVGN